MRRTGSGATPRRNRVTPFGDIVATPARGLLFGNRGVLHDEQGRLVRDWQVRRWLACRLQFRGRWRPAMRPGTYTGLFFLDEVTALAAGHRPCAECRNADYRRFGEAWAGAHGGGTPRAEDLDRTLHDERLGEGGVKRTHPARLADLPDAAMIELEGRAWLVWAAELVAWSPLGYTDRRKRSSSTVVPLLTPPSTVAVISDGYEPTVHPSARGR